MAVRASVLVIGMPAILKAAAAAAKGRKVGGGGGDVCRHLRVHVHWYGTERVLVDVVNRDIQGVRRVDPARGDGERRKWQLEKEHREHAPPQFLAASHSQQEGPLGTL